MNTISYDLKTASNAEPGRAVEVEFRPQGTIVTGTTLIAFKSTSTSAENGTGTIIVAPGTYDVFIDGELFQKDVAVPDESTANLTTLLTA